MNSNDTETILARLSAAEKTDAAQTDAIAAAVQQRDAAVLSRLLGVSAAEASKLINEVRALGPQLRPARGGLALRAIKRQASRLSLAAGLLLTAGNVGYRVASQASSSAVIVMRTHDRGAGERMVRSATSSAVPGATDLVALRPVGPTDWVCADGLAIKDGDRACPLTGETARVVATQDGLLIANRALQWVEDGEQWRLDLLLEPWDEKRRLDVVIYTQCQPSAEQALRLSTGDDAPRRRRIRFAYGDCRILESHSEDLP